MAALGDIATLLSLQLSNPHPGASLLAKASGQPTPEPIPRRARAAPSHAELAASLARVDPAAAVLAGVGEKLAGVRLEQSPPPSPASALDELESIARCVLRSRSSPDCTNLALHTETLSPKL